MLILPLKIKQFLVIYYSTCSMDNHDISETAYSNTSVRSMSIIKVFRKDTD